MQKLFIFFFVIFAVTRLTAAQNGYNYPRPFIPLPSAAGSSIDANDLSSSPSGSPAKIQFGSQTGSPPALKNQNIGSQPGTKSPSVGNIPAAPSSFNQEAFGHASGVGASIGGSHPSGIPSQSGSFVPSLSSGGYSASLASGSSVSGPSLNIAKYPGSSSMRSNYPGASSTGTSSATFPALLSPSPVFGGQAGIIKSSSLGGRGGNVGISSPASVFGGQSGAFGATQLAVINAGNIAQSSFLNQADNFANSDSSQGVDNNDGIYSNGDYSAIPGTPGVDYPIFTEMPQTSFDCKQQQYPGYYANVEAQCQVFHICALNTTFNFLCPNGTIFSQQHLVCVWWKQFDCNTAPSLYENNAFIYGYSKIGQTAAVASFENQAQGGFSLHPGQSGPLNSFGSSQGPLEVSSNFGSQRPSSATNSRGSDQQLNSGSSLNSVTGYPTQAFSLSSQSRAEKYPTSSNLTAKFPSSLRPSVSSHSSSQLGLNVARPFGSSSSLNSGAGYSLVPQGLSSATQSGGEQYPISPNQMANEYPSSVSSSGSLGAFVSGGLSGSTPSGNDQKSFKIPGYPPAGPPILPPGFSSQLPSDKPNRKNLP